MGQNDVESFVNKVEYCEGEAENKCDFHDGDQHYACCSFLLKYQTVKLNRWLSIYGTK